MNNRHELSVPELGKTEEINLIDWKVSPGENVTQGTEMAEIETMKSTFSLEAPADGQVDEVLVEPGTSVEVGQRLATIESV
jgi:pyruvate/2-oxoglutarate dehydrogenase complex dihydrolipoamide acyltransferase (E2) component